MKTKKVARNKVSQRELDIEEILKPSKEYTEIMKALQELRRLFL